MTSDWIDIELGKLVAIKHGFAFKGEHFVEEPTAHQLVTPGNFAIGGGFQLGKGKYYAGPVPAEYVLRRGDLVVTMTDLSRNADTLGYSAVIPETPGTTWLHNQRVGLVELRDSTVASLDFLHFLMRTTDYRHWVVASATGSTVKHTSPSRICSYRFRLPPLRQQRDIADVLSSLEDRISLLRETNATLEAIAQALFKSWFVDLDPVRAKSQGLAPAGMDEATAALFPDGFEESAQALVPKGWHVATLAEAFEINPSRSLRKGAEAKYLEMAGVPTAGHGADSIAVRAFGSGTKFRNGDTLLARITPCLENGKTAFVDFLEGDEIGWGSTEFIVLRPRAPLPEYFAYLLCRHAPFREFAERSMSGTSGRQRVQNDVLATYRVAVPPAVVAEAFGALIGPVQHAITSNHARAATLGELRDTLLPRLISGQLRLPYADEVIAEATHAD